MDDASRITVICHHRSQLVGQTQTPIRLGQEQHPAIRGDPSAVEGSRYLLAAYGWKRERQQAIVSHGGGGAFSLGEDDV